MKTVGVQHGMGHNVAVSERKWNQQTTIISPEKIFMHFFNIFYIYFFLKSMFWR